MDNENNILFDQFKNNELSQEARQSFLERLANDVTFKEEYELYLAMIAGIKAAGLSSIKADIQEIANNVKPKNYKPAKPGGGFGFGSFLSLAIVAAIGTAALLYTNVIPSKHEKIDQAKDWLHQWDEQIQHLIVQDTIYDTVYHYVPIEDPNVEIGDTIYGQ